MSAPGSAPDPESPARAEETVKLDLDAPGAEVVPMRYTEALTMAVGDCSLCNRPRLLDPSAGGCRCIFVESFDDAIARAEASAHAAIDRRARRDAALSGLLATAGLLAFVVILIAGWAILAG